MNPVELINFIVWYATTRSEVLSPIRLVKFLYLADLYHAREAGGRTLTGWPWAFVHYGPFCGEALRATDEAVQKGIIEARPYQSRYDGEQHFVYRSPHEERPRVYEILPIRVVSALQEAIRRWAGDTVGLLDHVYFETEPMLAAIPRQRLDFSEARWPPREQPVAMKRLSPDRVAEGKKLLAHLRARAQEGLAHAIQEAKREIRDNAYWTFLDRLDPQESLPDIQGTATFTPPNAREPRG